MLDGLEPKPRETPKHKHHDELDDAEEHAPARYLKPPSSEMNVTPLIDVLLVITHLVS